VPSLMECRSFKTVSPTLTPMASRVELVNALKTPRLMSTPPAKAYIPTDEECARLALANMSVMLQRWIMIQLMTGGRPQAGVDRLRA